MEPTKIYKQRFHINEEQTDSIEIYWKSGLKQFEIKHNNHLIKEFNSSEQILKGFEVFVPNLGNLKVKMHVEPFGFEVKIGNLFLTNSRIPAEAKLKPVANIFYFVGFMNLIPLLIFLIYIVYELNFSLSSRMSCGLLINLIIWLLVASVYITSGYLLKRGYLWSYFMGLIVFSLITLFYSVTFIFETNFFIFFLLVLRIFFLVVIITHIKSMMELNRHQKTRSAMQQKRTNKELLDTVNL